MNRTEESRTEDNKRREQNKTEQKRTEESVISAGNELLFLCPAARTQVSQSRVLLLFNNPQNPKSDGRDCGHKMCAL